MKVFVATFVLFVICFLGYIALEIDSKYATSYEEAEVEYLDTLSGYSWNSYTHYVMLHEGNVIIDAQPRVIIATTYLGFKNYHCISNDIVDVLGYINNMKYTKPTKIKDYSDTEYAYK